MACTEWGLSRSHPGAICRTKMGQRAGSPYSPFPPLCPPFPFSHHLPLRLPFPFSHHLPFCLPFSFLTVSLSVYTPSLFYCIRLDLSTSFQLSRGGTAVTPSPGASPIPWIESLIRRGGAHPYPLPPYTELLFPGEVSLWLCPPDAPPPPPGISGSREEGVGVGGLWAVSGPMP